MYFYFLENQDAPVSHNEDSMEPKKSNVTSPIEANESSIAVNAVDPDTPGSPHSQSPPPTEDGEANEMIIVNEDTVELDLNHGRIGKIENLEPLKHLER